MQSTAGCIGLEGLPFSGKTTFSMKLKKCHQLTVIPEHTIADYYLKKLANKKWPRSKKLMLKRQQSFLKNEENRKIQLTECKKPIVFDRTVISLISYIYVRTYKMIDGDIITRSFINECKYAIRNEKIIIPEFFVILFITPEDIIKRAGVEKSTPNDRNIEDFLLCEDTLVELNNLYSQISIRLSHRMKTESEIHKYLYQYNGTSQNN